MKLTASNKIRKSSLRVPLSPFLLQSLCSKLLLYELALVLLGTDFRKKVAVVDGSFHDKLILHHFSVRMDEVTLLLPEEDLHGSGVEFLANFAGTTYGFQLVTNTFFKHLETVFTELEVKLRKVGDWTNSGQNSVVPAARVFRAERRHGCDAFDGTESPKSLMFNVAAL